MDTKALVLVSFAVLVSLGTLQCKSQGQSVHVSKHIQNCIYKNNTYEPGEKFHADDCTFCHCPHHGGRVRCAIQDCQFLASCVRYEKEPGECCGRCVDHGCLHSDGKIYPPRSVVASTSCERCICPPRGGKVICSRVRCPPVMCVDAVKQPGNCCHSCPNGPNCLLEERVIPAGEQVPVGRCQMCQCPDKNSWSTNQSTPPRALCTVIDDKACD